MNKTQVIDISNVPHRWLTLLLHLQNAVPGVFQLIFPDAQAARDAQHRMSKSMATHPTWFHMLIVQRDCCVYVIKTQYVQKVVIGGELFNTKNG
jgi:hypothetical protein